MRTYRDVLDDRKVARGPWFTPAPAIEAASAAGTAKTGPAVGESAVAKPGARNLLGVHHND
jgi:hypothetical protein